MQLCGDWFELSRGRRQGARHKVHEHRHELAVRRCRPQNEHLYQLYAYIRSQSGAGDSAADNAEGILLYPALDQHVDEAVTIQGHRFRFVTVDLAAPSAELRSDLLDVVRLQTTYPIDPLLSEPSL